MMITLNEFIDTLDNEWSETGFFEKLRYDNIIDFDRGFELLENVKSFQINEEKELINRKLVSLLWYIPQFMEWQKERLSEKYDNELMKKYNKIIGHFNNEIERILGLP